MDNYIVRIYRRDGKHEDKIAGLVELVEAQEQRAFTSYSELWGILSSSAAGKAHQKKSGRVARRRDSRK